MEVTMHHNEKQGSSSISAGVAEVEGGEMTIFQAPQAGTGSGRRISKDHGVEDHTFALAMDQSGVLDSSQISTSSGDSNSSSSSSHHYSSSELSSSLSTSISTSASISVHSSSSSSNKGGENRETKMTKDNKSRVKAAVAVVDTSEGSPVFATCSTFSSSSSASTASVPTVRRSESWGALRSASVESGKSSGGSDKENSITSGDFKSTSMSSMTKEAQPHNNSESHQNLETYYTPSASMHSITPTKLNPSCCSSDTQRLPGGEDKKSIGSGKLKTNVRPEDLLPNLTEEKKDLNNVTSESVVEGGDRAVKTEIDDKATISASANMDEKQDIDGKKEKDGTEDKIENKCAIESIIMGIGDINELASASSESNASKDGSNGISPTTKELAKAAKLARKPPKKRNWYQQIFSASYKSRSGDFKKLFKELPIKERLLIDYSCALQKEILVQGRMYVSQGYLSFHANIFGWETQTSLRLRDITSITKEKTALVIPNAIQVVVDCGDKLFFTSFVTRDATYLMLFKLWQNALLEDGMPSKEIQRLIHSSYGEELVITSDDEIDDSLSCKSVVLGGDLADGSNIIAVCRDPDGSKSIVIGTSKGSANEIGPAIIVTSNLSSSIAAPKIKDQGHHNGTLAVGLEPSDSESSDSDDEFQAAEGMEEINSMDIPPCPVSHTEGRETINAVIPCNIDQLFTMLFTSSKFYLDFHTSRKTFNIHQAPWEFGKDGKQTRQVSMTVSLNAVMGPKHSQITETQIMDAVSKPGLFYVIDCESVNAGVPYADTFYVTVHFCLSRITAAETRLAVVADIKYKKSVWGITKSIIEKNAWAGLEEFYSHLERALKEECSKMSGSPLPSPKHSSVTTAPRRRPPRNANKRQAPGIPVGVPPVNSRSSLRGGTGLGTVAPTLSSVPDLQTETPAIEGSVFLKIILCVLGGLLVLNAFLYFKLTALETTAHSSTLFPPPSFTFTGEMPQNHQDWLLLLQKQESLHRTELQKWHEILMSALKILHQAESDLESLKRHIGSYSGGKYSVEMSTKQHVTVSSFSENRQKSQPTPSSTTESKISGDSAHRQDNRVDL